MVCTRSKPGSGVRDPGSELTAAGRGTEVPRYGCRNPTRTPVARSFSSAKLENWNKLIKCAVLVTGGTRLSRQRDRARPGAAWARAGRVCASRVGRRPAGTRDRRRHPRSTAQCGTPPTASTRSSTPRRSSASGSPRRRSSTTSTSAGSSRRWTSRRRSASARIVYTSSFLALPPADGHVPLAANDYQRTKVTRPRGRARGRGGRPADRDDGAGRDLWSRASDRSQSHRPADRRSSSRPPARHCRRAIGAGRTRTSRMSRRRMCSAVSRRRSRPRSTCSAARMRRRCALFEICERTDRRGVAEANPVCGSRRRSRGSRSIARLSPGGRRSSHAAPSRFFVTIGRWTVHVVLKNSAIAFARSRPA